MHSKELNCAWNKILWEMIIGDAWTVTLQTSLDNGEENQNKSCLFPRRSIGFVTSCRLSVAACWGNLFFFLAIWRESPLQPVFKNALGLEIIPPRRESTHSFEGSLGVGWCTICCYEIWCRFRTLNSQNKCIFSLREDLWLEKLRTRNICWHKRLAKSTKEERKKKFLPFKCEGNLSAEQNHLWPNSR